MPRIARKDYNSGYFHVMVQGISGEFIFKTPLLKQTYIKYIDEESEKFNVKILAYCIMGNHAHILVYIVNNTDLTNMMQKINTSFAILYNKLYKRVGYVFRDRFKTQKIESVSHLENCVRYIHRNPVAANICKNESEYLYSTYNKFIDDKIAKDVIKLIYGNNPDYIEKVKSSPQLEEALEFIDADNNITLSDIHRLKMKKECSNRIKRLLDKYKGSNLSENDKLYLIIHDLVENYDFDKKIIAESLNISRKRLYKILKSHKNQQENK